MPCSAYSAGLTAPPSQLHGERPRPRSCGHTLRAAAPPAADCSAPRLSPDKAGPPGASVGQAVRRQLTHSAPCTGCQVHDHLLTNEKGDRLGRVLQLG